MATIDAKTLDSLTPWQIAELIGCGYMGDMNPIDHGGVFYDLRDWREYGYASCVEFWHDGDTENTLMILTGTIHRDNVPEALKCLGIEPNELSETGWADGSGNEITISPEVEIEACRVYAGIEPDDYPGYKRRYNLDTWKEWRFWKSILPNLLNLGECAKTV